LQVRKRKEKKRGGGSRGRGGMGGYRQTRKEFGKKKKMHKLQMQ
jgi:hypothetical protein